MLTRSFDADFVNRVANDPSVRPFIGLGLDPLDLTPVINNPNVIALMCEHGGLVFLPVLDGLYSVHTILLPSGRGAKAVRAALEGVDWVFRNTDAKAITTEVPADNQAAKWLTLRCGFQFVGRREGEWIDAAGGAHDISDYVLTRPAWEARRAPPRIEGRPH